MIFNSFLSSLSLWAWNEPRHLKTQTGLLFKLQLRVWGSSWLAPRWLALTCESSDPQRSCGLAPSSVPWVYRCSSPRAPSSQASCTWSQPKTRHQKSLHRAHLSWQCDGRKGTGLPRQHWSYLPHHRSGEYASSLPTRGAHVWNWCAKGSHTLSPFGYVQSACKLRYLTV